MTKRKSAQLDLGFETEAEQENAPGLRHLFAASAARETEMQRAVMLDIDRLLDNPFQPRLDMDEEPLQELAAVMQLQGFQGVLVAREDPDRTGFYQITAGHRRREAARRAGLKVLPVVVQPLLDEEMVVRAVTENIQREDLSPLEEGRIYLMMSDDMGYTYAQIAKEVGKSVGYIRNRLRVAQSPPDVQSLVQARPDTLRAVVYLSKLKDETARTEIISQLLSGALTADDVRNYPGIQPQPLSSAPAQPDDGPTLVSVPGSNTLTVLHSPKGTTAGAKAPQTGAAQDERTRIRVRRSKLASILRTLLTYKDLVGITNNITGEEHSSLLRITALAEELCNSKSLIAH